jgi:hypothetical protein
VPPPDFPWYSVVQGGVLEQGDLLLGCPRFVLPAEAGRVDGAVSLVRETVDAVILTQSCDLAIRPDGQCEASDVLLCPFYFKKDLTDHPVFRKDEAWEEVRKGRRPFFHLLNECRLAAQEQDFALIDFHAPFTLSVPWRRNLRIELAIGFACCRRTASTCPRRLPGSSCALGCRLTSLHLARKSRYLLLTLTPSASGTEPLRESTRESFPFVLTWLASQQGTR